MTYSITVILLLSLSSDISFGTMQEDTAKCLAVTNTMRFWFPLNGGHFLTSQGTVSFSIDTLSHGIVS